MIKQSSIKEIFKQLDSDVKKLKVNESPDDQYKRKCKSLPLDEKKRLAWKWKMEGISIPSIASVFNINSEEVSEWLIELKRGYREVFEKETAADNLAGQLMVLEAIEEVALYEVRQASNDGKSFDPKLGKIVENKTSSRGVKAQFLKLAMDARKTHIDLLIKVGVLPTELTRMYRSLEDEGRLKQDESRRTGSERSKGKDQLIGDLLKELERSQSL